MAKAIKHLYEFGLFLLDPAERRFWRPGKPVPLTPKGFDTLVLLVRNQGRLLEKDELMRELWPNTFVEEGNLAFIVSTLRKALGEEQSGPRYIETIPKKGYRFVAQVKELTGETAERAEAPRLPAYHFAIVYAGLGQTDQAFGWLEKAYQERSNYLLFLKVIETMVPLRPDPRFHDLVRRIGLPP